MRGFVPWESSMALEKWDFFFSFLIKMINDGMMVSRSSSCLLHSNDLEDVTININ